MQQKRKAVVLLSGGVDSATVMAIARRDGFAPHALSFDYEKAPPTANPSELRFGEVRVGEREALVVTLLNPSTQTMALTNFTLEGDDITDFDLVKPPAPCQRTAPKRRWRAAFRSLMYRRGTRFFSHLRWASPR